jgi:hypothetical protein
MQTMSTVWFNTNIWEVRRTMSDSMKLAWKVFRPLKHVKAYISLRDDVYRIEVL